VRLAKYFPYTVSDKNAWLATVAGDVRTTVVVTGLSAEGRDMHRLDITDTGEPDTGKHRVWIHAMVHSAETTSAWVVEGLVDWLLTGDPLADALLDQCIFNIVPMMNPDGNTAGNYRFSTNTANFADGANLENDWASPWNSTEPEIVAIQDDIETFMGTSASPGSNPIEILLNLHSSHNVSYPFHFQHTVSVTNQTVHDLEGDWIAYFKARSPFANLGTTQSSTLGGVSRPFVEGMMFDRWSGDPSWTGSPNFLPSVMAITYEGTYGFGPDQSTWNTPDDYRQNGMEMGEAIADYFGITLATPTPTPTPTASPTPTPEPTPSPTPEPSNLTGWLHH
jgi:hypothetical protein